MRCELKQRPTRSRRIRPRVLQCYVGQILGDSRLHGLFLFVRSTDGYLSCNKWTDADGVQPDIHQHEGGDQGDPVMFLFSSLDALAEVRKEMFTIELLFAFSTVSTWCRTQAVLGRCLTFSVRSWPTWASACMPGRRGCGTSLVNAFPTSTIWKSRFGTPRGSRFRHPCGGQMQSCRKHRFLGWRRRAAFGRPWHGFHVLSRFSF